MARMKFMNTEIDNLTMQETLQAIDQLIQENKSAFVCCLIWKKQSCSPRSHRNIRIRLLVK